MPGTTLDTASIQRPGAFLGKITSAVRELAARQVDLSAPGLLLDVGCGNGLLFAEIGSVSGRSVGMDLDLDLLREGRRVLSDNRIENACLIQGNAGALPFRDGVFDAVLLLNTLINISDDVVVRRFLDELMRVCRPEGRIFVDIRNRSNPYLRLKYWWHNRTADFRTRAYHARQLDDLFAASDFRVVARHAVGSRLPFGPFSYLFEARRTSTAAVSD